LIAAKPTLGLNKFTRQVTKSPTKGRFSAASVVIFALMVKAGGPGGWQGEGRPDVASALRRKKSEVCQTGTMRGVPRTRAAFGLGAALDIQKVP
jgi:hypothetical protein